MPIKCPFVSGTRSAPRETRYHSNPPHSCSFLQSRALRPPHAFTLVEMLVAMAITLVMMAAVVTLFANVSSSVSNRRAAIELANQLRHVRNVLQQDLQGATCPGLTWQRPESNHGYIELIEGRFREGDASALLDGDPSNGELNYETSIIPSSNLPFRNDPTKARWATDGAGLGDYDDILMLTVRNEHEPFVGRVPNGVDARGGFGEWDFQTIESPLAEVVWFAIENPADSEDPNNFFGEPGMRTIYRRTLLIAPWVNPYRQVDADGDGIVNIGGANFRAVPGLVRLLPSNLFGPNDVARVIAAVIAFQDRYDLSVRAEWDHDIQHWKIVANTLADLTKRENRFGHFGFYPDTRNPNRRFPYPIVSLGSGYSGSSIDLAFVSDPEISRSSGSAQATANIQNAGALNGLVFSYTVDPARSSPFVARPFVYVDSPPTGAPATSNAMLNDEGQVVRVVHGPVPLWGQRRGHDVMLTDVLAFDLRVYDPGAPLYIETSTQTVLQPSDPGWKFAYNNQMGLPTSGNVLFTGQGAYVDMGYVFLSGVSPPQVPLGSSWILPWFALNRLNLQSFGNMLDVLGNVLAPGYFVYDTWSFHYENNGVDDDGDGQIDEGTDGLDGPGHYFDSAGNLVTDVRLGVDDIGERETAPPYDKPLRGVQVILRTYERDSRTIRQVRVNQHFMPE